MSATNQAQGQPLVIIPDLDQVRANAQNTRTALKNRSFTSGNVTAPFYGGAASTTIIGALLATVKASGIFDVAVSWAWVQAATGTYRWQVGSQTVASGMTISAATKVGPGQGGNVATTGAFISSGATIAVAGGGGPLVQFDTGVQTIGTAATAATFAYKGTIQNSISATVETPFTVGNQILVTFTLITTAQAATVSASTGGYAFELIEQP